MRIKLNFNTKGLELPINNQHIVNSFIHRCIGKDNEYHDSKNDYSISSLQNGKLIKGSDKIIFNKDAYITISSLNMKLINDILFGAYNTELIGAVKVTGVDFIDEHLLNGWNHFATLSPFIIKKYSDKKKYTFITLDGEDFDIQVKDYLIQKLLKIKPDLNLDGFDVRIPKHPSHKIKKILIKNVINLANQCQISINCSKEVATLLYNIGLGQSTGSGFGTIYKTENHKLYRN
jgi:CRISPR-associated endoribonuclease Cas6